MYDSKLFGALIMKLLVNKVTAEKSLFELITKLSEPKVNKEAR